MIGTREGDWRVICASEHLDLARWLVARIPLVPESVQILRDDYRSFVGILDAEGRRVVIKSPRLKNRRRWIRWTTLFRPGEAFDTFVCQWQLRQDSVPLAEPIVALEKRSWGQVVDSWWCYFYVEGRSCQPPEYPRLVESLQSLHRTGWVHGDPHFENFVWDGDIVRMLDWRPRRARFGSISRAYDFVLLGNSCDALTPHLPGRASGATRMARAYDRWIHGWRRGKKTLRALAKAHRNTAAETARVRVSESAQSAVARPGGSEVGANFGPAVGAMGGSEVGGKVGPAVGATDRFKAAGGTLKIALIVRHYHKRGGISRYVAALAERLAEAHEVHVYASSFEDADDPRLRLHRLPILSSRWLARRKKHALNGFFEVASFTLVASLAIDPSKFDLFLPQGDYLGRYDAFTVHSCHRAWLALARTGTRGWSRWKKSALNPLHAVVLFVERHALRNAKRVVAISRVTQQEVRDHYGVPEQRLVVVPIGVDLERFHPAPREDRQVVRTRHAISEHAVVALFPAHEFHRKGLAQVLRALAQVEALPLHLLVVGRDDPAPFAALLAELGLSGRVIFAGETSRIEEYYRAADLMVFPTRYEPFGMIVTEALASGLPVVVSALAGAAELIADGVDGILLRDPDDADEIAAALRRLGADPALRDAMGKAARAKAELHGWDQMVERLWSEYGYGLRGSGNSTPSAAEPATAKPAAADPPAARI